MYKSCGVSPDWLNGTALYYWFFDSSFGAAKIVQPLIDFLFVNNITISLITWSVILLELAVAISFLFSRKHKYFTFILAVSFHFFVILMYGLVTFFVAVICIFKYG